MNETKQEVIARAGNCEIYESNEVGWQLITEGTLLLEIDKGLDCFIYMFRILIKYTDESDFKENPWKQEIILPMEFTKNSSGVPFYYFPINKGNSFCGIRFTDKKISKAFIKELKKIKEVRIVKSYKKNGINLKTKCHSLLKKLKPSKPEIKASEIKLKKSTFMNKFTRIFSEKVETPMDQLLDEQEVSSHSDEKLFNNSEPNNNNLNIMANESTEGSCLQDNFLDQAPAITTDPRDQLNNAICNFKKSNLSRTDLTAKKSNQAKLNNDIYLKNELAKRNEYLRWSDSETESDDSYYH